MSEDNGQGEQDGLDKMDGYLWDVPVSSGSVEEMMVKDANRFVKELGAGKPHASQLRWVGLPHDGHTDNDAEFDKYRKMEAEDVAKKMKVGKYGKYVEEKKKKISDGRGLTSGRKLELALEIAKSKNMLYDGVAGQMYGMTSNHYYYPIDDATLKRMIHDASRTASASAKNDIMKTLLDECTMTVQYDNTLSGSEKMAWQGFGYMSAMNERYSHMIRFGGGRGGEACMLDINTLERLPTDPKYYCTTELPYAYDPTASPSKEWLKFVDDIMLGDRKSIMLLQEMMGYCISGDRSKQTAFFLLGESGRNGKGVLARLLRMLVGENDTSSVPIADFGNRFSMSSMVGKKLNIDEEIQEHLTNGAINGLKRYTGGRNMSFERKGRDVFESATTAAIVVLANRLPFGNEEESFYSRLSYLPFEMRAVEDPKLPHERKRDDTIEDRLAKQLPAIFNWAIEGLRRFREIGPDGKIRGFTVSEKGRRIALEHKIQNNLAVEFTEMLLEMDGDMLVDPASDIPTAVQLSGIRIGVFQTKTAVHAVFRKWLDEEKPQVRMKPRCREFVRSLRHHYRDRLIEHGGQMKIVTEDR